MAGNRRMNSFILYLTEERQRIKSENPGIKMHEIAVIAAYEWKEIDKDPWIERARQIREKANSSYSRGTSRNSSKGRGQRSLRPDRRSFRSETHSSHSNIRMPRSRCRQSDIPSRQYKRSARSGNCFTCCKQRSRSNRCKARKRPRVESCESSSSPDSCKPKKSCTRSRTRSRSRSRTCSRSRSRSRNRSRSLSRSCNRSRSSRNRSRSQSQSRKSSRGRRDKSCKPKVKKERCLSEPCRPPRRKPKPCRSRPSSKLRKCRAPKLCCPPVKRRSVCKPKVRRNKSRCPCPCPCPNKVKRKKPKRKICCPRTEDFKPKCPPKKKKIVCCKSKKSSSKCSSYKKPKEKSKYKCNLNEIVCDEFLDCCRDQNIGSPSLSLIVSKSEVSDSVPPELTHIIDNCLKVSDKQTMDHSFDGISFSSNESNNSKPSESCVNSDANLASGSKEDI